MARIASGVGTTRGFLQSVNKFVKESPARSEAVLQDAILDLYLELDRTAPYDTGFLRSSLTIGVNGNVPQGPNAKFQSDANVNTTLGNIANIKLGDRVSMVYQATYARRLEYGFTGVDSLGRQYNQPGRFWIAAAGSKWRSIIRNAAARLKGG